MVRILGALLLLLAAHPGAQAAPVRGLHTQVELVAETARPAAGKAATLALRITPDAGWHSYWKNGGDSGFATDVQWSLPAGATAGPLSYPAPARIPFGELMNYGYTGEAALLAELKLPAGFTADQPLPVSARVGFLVCDDELCVPEDVTVRIDLRTGDGAADPQHKAAFARWRAALPQPSPWPARFRALGGRFTLVVEPGAAAAAITSAYFFPDDDRALAASAPQRMTLAGGQLRLDTQGLDPLARATLSGVLSLADQDGRSRALAITARADPSLPPEPPQGPAPLTALTAISFALLGGMLLNLMPCVFPILALKALSLARSGGDEAHARAGAWAYTAGSLATFAAVGGGLLALRAGGEAVGWGFQLQNPTVVTALALLMTAIALNLFGLFEVRLPGASAGDALTRGTGASASFWTGALAVLVATPCTAPFMAAALGAALTLPWTLALLVFLALGLGMALPFLLIAHIPALRTKLPRPGAWMDRLRHWLGFPMLATALWLFWVASRIAGEWNAAFALSGAGLMALGLWQMGRGGARAVLAAGLVAIGIGGALWATRAPARIKDPAAQATWLGARPYSADALAELHRTGAPAFVYFTADWCITCKVNEATALAAADVAKAFARKGVVTLVGDWTQRDDAIARTLAHYGRSGVPLYLWFPPDAATPEILPQILTPSMLTQRADALQSTGD